MVKGSKNLIPSDGLMNALKNSLKPTLYNKLVEHAAHYAPPYLPLYEFAKMRIEETFVTFSICQWREPGLEDEFIEFLKKNYPEYTLTDVKRHIKQAEDSVS